MNYADILGIFFDLQDPPMEKVYEVALSSFYVYKHFPDITWRMVRTTLLWIQLHTGPKGEIRRVTVIWSVYTCFDIFDDFNILNIISAIYGQALYTKPIWCEALFSWSSHRPARRVKPEGSPQLIRGQCFRYFWCPNVLNIIKVSCDQALQTKLIKP